MEVIYGLLPGMLFLSLIGVVLFFWAVKSGQYDDLDGAANRILMDNDEQVELNDDKESDMPAEETDN